MSETQKLSLAIVYLNAELEKQRDRADRAEAALEGAWDEGYDAGLMPSMSGPNPYRSEATA